MAKIKIDMQDYMIPFEFTISDELADDIMEVIKGKKIIK